jgi:hypothetical protein
VWLTCLVARLNPHPGSEHDTIVLANSLENFTYETFMDSKLFWDDVPMLADCLLRRA